MKRKIRSKMVIVLLILLVNIILTGCTSENSNTLKKLFIKEKIETSDETSDVIVKRNGEHITLENMLDTNVYVDYEIYLYDNKKEILYEKKYEKIFLKKSDEKCINICKIKPEHLTYDSIAEVTVSVNNVYEYTYAGYFFISILIFCALVIFVSVILLIKEEIRKIRIFY